MTEAARQMRQQLPANQQAFGYVWIVGTHRYGYPYNPKWCEICLRDNKRETTLRVDIADIDRDIHTYEMAVSLTSGNPEYSSLFISTIKYDDGTWFHLDHDTKCFNKNMVVIHANIINIFHAIIHRLIIQEGYVPKEVTGIKNAVWYLGFSSEEKKWIENDASVCIEGVVTSMQIFAHR